MIKSITLRDYKQRLLRVLIHIQQNLDTPLPLEELAAIACLSPYHFHRVFSGMLGESLHAHIRRLRLERAAVELKRDNEPVIQLALAAGFETHEAFSRVFRQTFGLSPSAYRKNHHVQMTACPPPSGIHFEYSQTPRHFRTLTPSDHPTPIHIGRLAPIRVAFLRHVGPYCQLGPTWDSLFLTLGCEAILSGGTRLIGISYDDPSVTAPDKIRYDACISVDQEIKPEGELGVQVIPGGDYAIMTHFGPYELIGDTYTKLLGQWLPRSGRELRSSPCYELYLNSPENTAPVDLVTDLHAPLQPLIRSPREHRPSRKN